ncbi:hypothetical protein F4775DRAFT_588333 [Biscogniauxia sp. FL1348]|nr:hypothetical protein F4775DRAFT_588333 [Biscogniauxia sp. FL1348]
MHSEASSFLYGSLHDIVSTFGAILWAVRLGSQALSNNRRGTVLDVHCIFGRHIVALSCLSCWVGWGVCEGIAYLLLAITSISAAFRDESKFDLAAFIQPHVSVLALLVLVYQICMYELRFSRFGAWLAAVGLGCSVTILETWCIRVLMSHGDGGTGGAALPYSVTLTVAVGGLAGGYGPLYVELVRHQGRGVTVATTGLLLSHLVWMLRTRQEHAVASALGLTFDELATEHVKADQPFRYAASRKNTATTFTTYPSRSSSSSWLSVLLEEGEGEGR